jgi:tryptophan-rich sensory protein
MSTYSWYSQLLKPSWAPPSFLFGPVWTFLYVLIVISFGKVFMLAWKKEIALIVALPFLLNIIFNLLFTPIQFGLKNNILASVDILLILTTLVWAIIAIYGTSTKLLGVGGLDIRWIAYIQIPYLLWVSFATVLQLTITYLNK